MECFLLLLAIGIVSPDRLDRTYLPPPGAEFSGGSLDDLQIPLEYPERRKPMEAIQNDEFRDYILGNTFLESPRDQDLPTTLVDFSSPMSSNELSQTPSLTANDYDFTVEAPRLRPDKAFYDNFSPKLLGYLPSQRQTMPPLLPAQNPTFKTPSINGIVGSSTNEKGAGYYYDVPVLPNYGNNIANHRPNEVVSTNTQQFELLQYPNQNDSFLLANGQAFIPKPATTVELVENDQPNTFGYYGGNPMIMTYQNVSSQGLGNIGLRSKFREFDNISPIMPANQDKKIANKTSLRPFQTPSVIKNQQNVYDNDIIKNYSSPIAYTDQTKFPISLSGYQTVANENAPINFEQKNIDPVISTFRQERPQADSDKSALTLNYKNLITPEGYSHNFDTSNGIHADESGTANNGVKAIGFYSYIGDDGKNYSVSYTADENGFRPIGDHLPTPPPVPEAIKRVIEQAARDKAAGIIDDGFYDEKKYGHMIYQGVMDRSLPIKNRRIPDINQRVGSLSSEPNKIQNKPITITEIDTKKKANVVQIHNGYIPKNSIEPTTRNQFESTNTQYPTLTTQTTRTKNLQEPKIKLPTQESKDGSKTSLVKSEENYLGRRPSSSIYNDHQNIHSNINKTINNLQEDKAASSKGLPENLPDINDNQLQDQSRQLIKPAQDKQLLPTITRTYVNDGYYYVPPFIKFNEIPGQFGNKKDLTNTPAQKDDINSILKRIGVDYTQDQHTFNNVNSVTSNTKLTREPYITGPDDQNFKYEHTTPMPSTKYKNRPINEYSTQFYQTTTNPVVGEQTLSSTVENRINTPSEIPGISVTQKILATTSRPINLEVNQNVKIYGFGESKPIIATNGHLDKIPDSNEGFYTTPIPNEVSKLTGYPGVSPTGEAFQETTEKLTIGNDYTIELGAPAGGNLVQTGPYFNPDFGQQLNSVGVLNSPVPIPSIFGNIELPSSEAEGTIPTFTTQSQSLTEKVIGEDFSGPKQPYGFNPETGYYYK